MKALIKRAARRLFADALTESDGWDTALLLQGAQASLALRNLETINSLADAEFKVFAQFGDDGIIEWLVQRLPGIPKSFVEFGVESYGEANTRFLLQHRNWRGLIMDGDPAHMQIARRRPWFWKHDLTAHAAFIDRDNINDLISGNGFTGEIGLLSVDLDGNDYWVWQAVDCVNPWLVIVEYNAVFGDLQPLTIPYDPAFERAKTHSSYLYWGTSIRAVQHMADARGYTLLGSNRAGNNAYLVRNDLLQNFDGKIEDRRPHPSLYRESRSADGQLSHVSGARRRAVIADMPVVDIVRDQTFRFGDIGDVYSDHWLAAMGQK